MAKIERICKQCGKKFEVYVTKKSGNRGIYCSKKCRGRSERSNIKRVCLHCGKIFYVIPSRIKKGGGKYCCVNCMNDARRNKISKICPVCGKKYYAHPSLVNNGMKKYCSYKCWSIGRFTGESKICIECGKSFYINKSRIEKGWGKYCSKECQSKHQTGANAPGWLGGKSYEPYCILFNNDFKDRVRAFFGNRCVICGKPQDECKRKLSVHHVIYNKNTCCDDSDKLFVSLCGVCHNKTNFNREYWQEYFTKMIKEEYDGKCYYTKEEYDAISSA